MTETEFEIVAADRGHGDFRAVEFDADLDPELHAHPWSMLVYLERGDLTVVFEDCEVELEPGHWCEVAPGELHSERTGADGASVIVATRTAD